MGRFSWVLALSAALAMVPAGAQTTGHYVPGVEGLEASTLPPPGIYYRQYDVFYTSGRDIDKHGKGQPIGFSVDVFAQCHRVIWLSKKTVLGGTYGADVLLPVINTNLRVRAAGLHSSKFGLGDLYVAPLVLSWHGPRWDAACALGAWLPTGDYSSKVPASPGKGNYTVMATAGGTGYIDKHKTIAGSLLSRWEVNTQNGAKVTPGAALTLEGGLGKALPGKLAHWNVGLTGYSALQLSKDSGSGASGKGTFRAFAAGPEVKAFVPSIRSFFSLRTEWEFGCTNHTQGNVSTFTFTKIF